MNIIEAVKLMKSNPDVKITREKWFDGEFCDYYLQYDNIFYKEIVIVDRMASMRLDYDYCECTTHFNFDMEDILYDKWKIWEE